MKRATNALNLLFFAQLRAQDAHNSQVRSICSRPAVHFIASRKTPERSGSVQRGNVRAIAARPTVLLQFAVAKQTNFSRGFVVPRASAYRPRLQI